MIRLGGFLVNNLMTFLVHFLIYTYICIHIYEKLTSAFSQLRPKECSQTTQKRSGGVFATFMTIFGQHLDVCFRPFFYDTCAWTPNKVFIHFLLVSVTVELQHRTVEYSRVHQSYSTEQNSRVRYPTRGCFCLDKRGARVATVQASVGKSRQVSGDGKS